MQDDTQAALFKLNTNTIAALVAIITAFIGGVAWGVRLEYKTQENEKSVVKHEAEISALREDSSTMKGRFGIMELDIKYIKTGIDEIKTNVRK